MQYLLGIFVILHGFVYTLYFVPKPSDEKWPFIFEKGWLAKRVGEPSDLLGKLLIALAVLGFVIGGLSVMIAPGADLWKVSLVIASTLALAFQILFWQKQLFIGALINILLLYGILIARWSFS